MTYQVEAVLDFHQLIAAPNGVPVTDSLLVARAFGKRHDDVLRKIRLLECSDDYRARNFAETSQPIDMPNGGVRNTPVWQMTKDGFIFLVMGFTGKKAAVIKEAYINAFNWMTEELHKLSRNYETERNAVMLEYMKESDVASMSGRLLNRWGRVKKPSLLARIEKLEQEGQFTLPFFKIAS
jgi:Rha family phage regulatory protein